MLKCSEQEALSLIAHLHLLPAEELATVAPSRNQDGLVFQYSARADRELQGIWREHFQERALAAHLLQEPDAGIAKIDPLLETYRMWSTCPLYDVSIIYRFQEETKEITALSWTYRYFLKEEVEKDLAEIEKQFPDVMDTAGTLAYLKRHGASAGRFGDGEFNLMEGEDIPFQKADPQLAKRLQEVIAYPSDDRFLVCIPRLNPTYNNAPNIMGELNFWENYWYKRFHPLRHYLNQPFYGDAFLSRESVFRENPLEDLTGLWEGQEAVIVSGGRFHLEPRLFGNLKGAHFIKAPATDAFDDYDRLLGECLAYPKDRLFLLACGPTATVLAFDLMKTGRRALDIGHLPNSYDQFLGRAGVPEELPMEKLKVAVYAIAKNEEMFVDRWLQSMSEADEIYVFDTGSTDETVEKLRAGGARVTVGAVSPWRFDEARNRSLALVPEDVDICVCTDLDETFRMGWRQTLERAWSIASESPHKQAFYTYNWRLKPDGSPDYSFTYSKIHDRHGWRWKYPIHEYVFCDEASEPVMVPDVILDHFPDNSKPRSDYLPLLELATEEDPEDARMVNLLGREYFVTGAYSKAIATLENYLELEPDAVEGRGQAMGWIANSWWSLGDEAMARQWFFRALGECGHRREPYVDFAKMALTARDWELVRYLVAAALKITETFEMFYTLSSSWDHTLYELGLQACYHLGDLETAAAYAAEALERDPNNRYLQDWERLIQDV